MLGLQACHAAGVIHRDVKPENILFDDDFVLKLCDFGLASILPPDEVTKTGLTDVEGTQLDMAPEIDSAAAFRGPPVDVWACGVVLFIMLTGFPPYESAELGDSWYDLVVSGNMTEFWAAQPLTIKKPSALAVDLINGLLRMDVSLRLSIHDALAHPWLEAVMNIDSKDVLQQMRNSRRQCNEISFDEGDFNFESAFNAL